MKLVNLPRVFAFVFVAVFAAFSVACVSEPGKALESSDRKSGKVRIGFSMDTLKEERWQKDRDFFIKRAEELGAEVIVQSADGKDDV
ncbi:MAG: D-xylose transporter subunit XylF, partial [Acidobacteriota bacterium]|nr:D-xylose transporter subunit XylF [Acidobacteriota bacterium]